MELGEHLRGKLADFEACRLVLGVAHLSARAEDGTLFDYDVLTGKELAAATLRFKLGEYRQLGESWDRTHEEWLTYAPADRGLITAQHGVQRTHYVRIGAEPDLDTQITNAREALAEAERKAQWAQQTVEWRKEDLAKLEADDA